MDIITSITKSTKSRNFVAITKGAYTTIVCVKNTRCLAISETFEAGVGIPFIPYVFDGHTSKEAYEKYLHLIGKLVLKKDDSKYFGCPIWEEHCENGFPGAMNTVSWEILAKEILQSIRKERV